MAPEADASGAHVCFAYANCANAASASTPQYFLASPRQAESSSHPQLARVHAAHRILVSNAGEDDYLSYGSGDGEFACYLLLYQQLIGWSGIQLVDSPAQADLIFQVYGDSSQGLFDKSPVVYLHLTILDPATQEVLWTYTSESFSTKALLKPISPTNPAPMLVRNTRVYPHN
jgi:hypothetical protein